MSIKGTELRRSLGEHLRRTLLLAAAAFQVLPPLIPFDSRQFVPIAEFRKCTNVDYCKYDTNADGAFIVTWRSGTNPVQLQRSADLVSWETVWAPAPGATAYSYGEWTYGRRMFYRVAIIP